MATLTVIAAFGSYAVGQSIADAATIAAILASPQKIFVVTVADASPGSGLVTPTRPDAVAPTNGPPAASLAITYGYALDLTSTPAALYRWTGTAWAVVLQAAAAPVAPVLQALGLASLAATAGVPFSTAITGQTAGSQIAAASSDGTALTVSNGQVSGTFAAAGSPTVTLTETLAGATGSPKPTQLTITVSAPSSSGQTLDFTNPANSSLLGAI